MKKIMFLCLCALLASCSSDEELQDMSANEGKLLPEELENVINDYELVLKGYTLDELNKEKDELTPTTQEETDAESWIIKAIQDSIDKVQFTANNRTRTDASAYTTRATAMEGVFKYETCGNYREFIYLMDCEDGGDTHSTGNIGATRVDGDGNVEFHFCVIPYSREKRYAGILVFYQLSPQIATIVKRHHDNEDHNNRNHVINNAGLTSFGPNHFGGNTDFFWCVSGSSGPKLPFRYGLLGNAPLVGPLNTIWIDDENGKNSNHTFVWDSFHPTQGYELPADKRFNGITPGRNTIYEIIIH